MFTETFARATNIRAQMNERELENRGAKKRATSNGQDELISSVRFCWTGLLP